jgi:hypothetical protein
MGHEQLCAEAEGDRGVRMDDGFYQAGTIELVADPGQLGPDVPPGPAHAVAHGAAAEVARQPSCRVPGMSRHIGDGHECRTSGTRKEGGGYRANAPVRIVEDDGADRLPQRGRDPVVGRELDEQLSAIRVLRHGESRFDASINRRRLVEHECAVRQRFRDRRRLRRRQIDGPSIHRITPPAIRLPVGHPPGGL